MEGSDDEIDREPEDDYDIDNEFFVPHGHLSDEEMQHEDEDLEMFDNDPENQKIKLKIIQEEFTNEMKKKTYKLKPRLIGMIWENADGSQPSNCSIGVWEKLQSYAALFEGVSVKVQPKSSSTNNINEANSDDENLNKASNVRRLKIRDRDVPDLIRLINGNTHSCNFLIKEFQAYIAKTNAMQRPFSNASIRNKIKELAVWQACPEEGPMYKKLCWYVPRDVCTTWNVDDSTFPNTWQYTVEPRKAVELGDLDGNKEKILSDVIDLSDSNSCNLPETLTPETIKQASTRPANFNIAKFIRVLSEEEKKKQFGSLTLRRDSTELPGPSTSSASPSTSGVSKVVTNKAKPSTGPQKVKKRVNLLHSGPCGTEISTKLKTTLVTQFLNSNKKPTEKKAAQNKNDVNSSPSTAGTSVGAITSKAKDPVIHIIDD